MAGPMRGTRWAPASGGKVARLLCGTYEREQTQKFCDVLAEGDILFDVGASVGYYTLLSAKFVGLRGHVVAFEPDPKNIAYLRRHVKANQLSNVSIHEMAVADQEGTARFEFGTGTGTGRLSSGGSLSVPVTSLDKFSAEHNLRPTHIKIDVEGAETQVLKGARELLSETHPTIFLSTHGSDVHETCCRLLRELNYDLQPMNGGDLRTSDEVFCRAA